MIINWPKTIALIILTALLFWGYGCPSKTTSLITPGKKITRPELQIEFNTIIATGKMRLADLDQKDQFRDIIFENAVLMVKEGGVNPTGIITLLLGLYGAARGAKDIKDRVIATRNKKSMDNA